jgi:hypothetical protein
VPKKSLTAETDILLTIKHNEYATFEELVVLSLWSPGIIDKTLRVLKRQGRIDSK